MDAGKPDTMTVNELQLKAAVRLGDDALLRELEEKITGGTTVAIRDEAGSVCYISTTQRFQEYLKNMT